MRRMSLCRARVERVGPNLLNAIAAPSNLFATALTEAVESTVAAESTGTLLLEEVRGVTV